MNAKLPPVFTAFTIVLFSTASLAAPPAFFGGVQSHTQRVYRSASGAECKPINGGQECVSIGALEERNWEGRYLQTWFEVTEFRANEAGYEFRNVRCPVAPSSLKVTKNWASLSVTMDTDLPDCYRIGLRVTYDPYSEETYYFTGTVTADGSWLNPGNQFQQLSNTIQTNNATGEQFREICQIYSSWQVINGGFTVQETFHAFSSDAPADFYFTHCNNVTR